MRDTTLISNARSSSCAHNSSACPGIFETSANQTLVLLLDFKEDGDRLIPFVNRTLQSLRANDYLSFWNGSTFQSRPLTVVVSGKAPKYLEATNAETVSKSRDIFYDAPLDRLSNGSGRSEWTSTNSYYASVSFKSSIGSPLLGRWSAGQLQTIRSQIRVAKERGLKTRYWDTPAWPTSLRNHVWQTLVDEGADVLSVDDLESAAFGDWRATTRHHLFDA